MVVFIVLALLFQPFLKISLGRVIWNIVDVCVAVYLLVLLFNTVKNTGTHSSSTTKRNDINLIIVFCLLFGLSAGAQTKEHTVILWDVTGSLLPKEAGTRDLNGSKIPVYAQGNGMWKSLKESIIECIEYREEDPGNEITIVTFNDAIRDVYSEKASAEGKQSLIDFVRNYQYKTHKYTNIVDPIKKFYSLLEKEKVNYMFLYTDGDNDHPSTRDSLIPTLDSWSVRTGGNNAYGFYVLVHPDADKKDIRASVETQDNFWMVQDAKVRIKTGSFPSSIKYNVRDQKGPKTVCFGEEGLADADGEVQLVSNDEFYDITCSDLAISNGVIKIEVKPKAGVAPPECDTILLFPKLSGNDPYTFIGPKEISLIVSNLPERSVNLTIEGNNFGKASYHGSFFISKEASTPASSDIKVDFSEQAKKEHSSALMRVYFVDKKTEEIITPASQQLTISINGTDLRGDSLKLTPEMASLVFKVNGGPRTKKGLYYGRIELIPTNLDNFTINGAQDVFKWKMSFRQKWNPLEVGLAWLVGILLAAFIIWMFLLKPIFYPRFGSIQKTFNVPGMAPLIIKFKGARMVVLAASHQKKQSAWNRFWTGKILYKTHPAFICPIAFKPSSGRRILAKVQTGTYQIMPNPMPGVGSATIDDARTNKRITIN